MRQRGGASSPAVYRGNSTTKLNYPTSLISSLFHCQRLSGHRVSPCSSTALVERTGSTTHNVVTRTQIRLQKALWFHNKGGKSHRSTRTRFHTSVIDLRFNFWQWLSLQRENDNTCFPLLLWLRSHTCLVETCHAYWVSFKRICSSMWIWLHHPLRVRIAVDLQLWNGINFQFVWNFVIISSRNCQDAVKVA